MQGNPVKRRKEWFWDSRCPSGCKVLATHGICHDLKDRLSSGDPQAGESSDCNWGCVRRDLLRRGAVVCAGCAIKRDCERSDSLDHFECHKYGGKRLSIISIDIHDCRIHDCQFDHPIGAIADEPEFGAESLLWQRHHGHGIV
jgi:hypothetical protein